MCCGLVVPTPCTPASGSFRRVMPEIPTDTPLPASLYATPIKSLKLLPEGGDPVARICALTYPPVSCALYVTLRTVDSPRPTLTTGVVCHTRFPFATLTCAAPPPPVSVLS